MHSTKWAAPPSRRSSRSTEVITTYCSRSAAIVRGQLQRFVRVQRIRATVTDVAERAAARALVAHDHERRGPLAEALADVRARCFLADRVQLLLAQDALDLVETARRQRRLRAYPVGFAQHVGGRHDLDRNPGRLAEALLLDAGVRARLVRRRCRGGSVRVRGRRFHRAIIAQARRRARSPAGRRAPTDRAVCQCSLRSERRSSGVPDNRTDRSDRRASGPSGRSARRRGS